MSRKKHSEAPSTSVPAGGLASSQVTRRRLQFPNNLQSQSPQEKHQSQPVCPWSSHVSSFGQSPSPFLRHYHALFTSATVAGELLLFGGYEDGSSSSSNHLHVISTQDFSTTLLETSGDVPSPRYGHRAVLTGTTLLIWGGRSDVNDQKAQNWSSDDSLYLLNLVSREWTRIVVDGPGPGGRFYHTMTLVGSKLFVFGGRTFGRRLNDIWALDLNCLKSNPFWESYDPAPENEKPLPRAGHVSVTTGDRIIIFGGRGDPHDFNDTWAFDISTRKWTELQCTGSIPYPSTSHAAALIDDVMYVFGGYTHDKTYLDDLTTFNLSTQRWIAFQNIGPSPCGRFGHAMACDGTCVFVLGGKLSPGAQVDEAKLIHVLDTRLLIYPKPDSNTVRHSEKTTRLSQRLSAGHPTQGQPQHRIFSSSEAGVAQSAFPFQITTSEDMGRPTSPQVTHEQNPGSNVLSQLMGMSDKPRRVPQEGDYSESSTEHHPKLVGLDASSGKEVVRLEHERIADLERQLSKTLAAQTEWDRYIAQLTDQLAKRSALLEQAKANAAEVKKHAGLEQHELQVKFDELQLSRDQAEANGVEAKRHAGLEKRELQANLDELLLSRDEHLRTLEQAESALRKATSCATDADKQSHMACEHEMELAEVRAELEAVRLRLADAEDGWAKSKADADTLRAQTAAGLVDTDADRVMHRLMERMRTMEAEMASRRWNDKSIEEMECRNEG